MLGEKVVDVVIPVFNREDTIVSAINSVLSQSGDFVRNIIVIDDGSTDTTAEVILNLNSIKIQLVRTENNGVSKARNLGVQLASADWIAFLDADDFWEADKLAIQLKYANLKKADFVCGSINKNIIFKNEIISFVSLCSGNYIATSTVMLKRELAISLMPLFNSEMTFAEDYLAWLKCVTVARAVYISSNLATYILSDKPRYDWIQIIKNLKQLNLEYFFFLMRTSRPLITKVTYPFLLALGTLVSMISIWIRFIQSNKSCTQFF